LKLRAESMAEKDGISAEGRSSHQRLEQGNSRKKRKPRTLQRRREERGLRGETKTFEGASKREQKASIRRRFGGVRVGLFLREGDICRFLERGMQKGVGAANDSGRLNGEASLSSVETGVK